jgi:glycosyltransferase involved in cell wall biosynthesis
MPDLRLVFVGDGPHKAVLREEVKRLNLDKHIVFMGEVDEETLKTLYYACDLNLYPVDDQTFGLVPFEALACGKVSVVSQRSGAAILLKGISAAIIADPIVDEIVGVIKRVREGKIDLEEMARRGKRFVKESLTWKAYAKVVNEILKKAHDSFLNRVS